MPDPLHTSLARPFIDIDLEWKVQTCGKSQNGRIWALVVPYLSARAIQNRLDETVGPANWKNRYDPIMKGTDVAGWLCYLAIRGADGEWVEKCDGADLTDIEAIKGGLSNALKRAAVQWGMGRYLYGIEECWANVHDKGAWNGKTKEGDRFKWDPPPIKPLQRPQAIDQAQAEEPAGNALAAAQPAAPTSPIAPATPALAGGSPARSPEPAKPTAVTTAKPSPAATKEAQKIAADVGAAVTAKQEATVAVKALEDVAGKPFAERAWRAIVIDSKAPLAEATKAMGERTALLRALKEAIDIVVREGAEDQVRGVLAVEEETVPSILRTLQRLAGMPAAALPVDPDEPPF